ncbi:HIRAN domain-containing protein [bacterium]|nr:HIRAN domain-containing protein [bacterium]
MAFWIIGGLILIFVLIHQFKSPSEKSEDPPLSGNTNPTPTKPQAPRRSAKPDADGKRHRIAGTSYHTAEIMKFAHENPDYKLTKKQIISMKLENTAIYKYEFDPVTVTLEPEPDNPNDKNAIKVLFNGVHIGYIKAGSCAHILKLIKTDRIESISGRLYGGPSKMVCCYEDSPEDAELEKSDGTVGAEIRIVERPE